MATLQVLRRAIGGLTGDLDILTLTAAGSTTTATDVLNANVETNSWKGRLGYFSGGTSGNLGRTVRITANDKATQTLTFTPAVVASTASGDTLELYNRDGQGPTIQQIHNAINLCIEFVSKGALTEVISSEVTFDQDAPDLTIPGTWRRLVAVEYQLDNDAEDWVSVPEAEWTDAVDRVGYTVRLDGLARAYADTRPIRLRGYTTAGQLAADNDTTLVDTEWLVHAAVSQILMNLATQEKVPERRAADYRATAQYFGTSANAFRTKVPSTVRGNAGVVLGGAG